MFWTEVIGVNKHVYPASTGISVFRGRGFIAGQGQGLVTRAGAPARALVCLYIDDGDGIYPLAVARAYSSSNGEYMFDEINESMKFTVIAFDQTGQFNAVIRRGIIPAPMP